jgi:16S rRNA processing protein RimM
MRGDMNSWQVVGRVRDAHGIKGEIFVALRAKRADWLDVLSVLGLKSSPAGEVVPFEVEAARAHKDGLIVRLKGVTDRNGAEALRGQTVTVPQDYVEAEEGNTVFLGQLLGLEVVDQDGHTLGEIVDLGSNGAQDLLVIKNAKGRFDVPLVDDFIGGLDLKSRRLLMTLPEGLVEV